MNIQAAGDSLIAQVIAATGKDGKGIAVNSKGGNFLLIFGETAGGEYERVGIDDRLGEAFYIRLRGAVDETESTNLRRGSCGTASRITAKCRLVAMSHCDSVNTLATNFRNALTGYRKKLITPDIYDSHASPKSIQYDFATIVIDEVPEDKREEVTGWEGAMRLIAIDFDLNYTLEDCGTTAEKCAC
jgi:hypothetical protein